MVRHSLNNFGVIKADLYKSTGQRQTRDNQQQRSLAEDGTTSGRGGDQEKEMEMDRSHPQKGTDIHYTPGPDLESPGKEKEGATKEQLEKGPGGRLSGDGIQLERGGETGPGPSPLACCCGWPMPPAGK